MRVGLLAAGAHIGLDMFPSHPVLILLQ
jgi:hypothetical protein